MKAASATKSKKTPSSPATVGASDGPTDAQAMAVVTGSDGGGESESAAGPAPRVVIVVRRGPRAEAAAAVGTHAGGAPGKRLSASGAASTSILSKHTAAK